MFFCPARPLWLEGQNSAAVAESPVYARADQFVFRLSPGEHVSARLFATNVGMPYAPASVIAVRDPGGLQQSNGSPDVAVPQDAIDFPGRVVTGADGVAEFVISAADPGNPRGYIDGQVYGIRPALEETMASNANVDVNPWNFISVLVWTAFTPDSPPTWWGRLQPIFQQYANLYPIMKDFVDLSSYESVAENRELLLLAFGLDVEDPNSMPVTRDLSPAKRSAILSWLRTVPDGKPLLGTPPPALAREEVPSPEALPETREAIVRQGGKAAAAAARLSQLSTRV